MEQFKIAEAYVEFSTRGQDRQERSIDRVSRKIEEAERRQSRSASREELRKEAAERRKDRTERYSERLRWTNQAFGSLPFVGGASGIAEAGLERGGKGMAAQAAAGAIRYGLEGVNKANPAAIERMQYQADRLQAIVGSRFSPAIDRITKGIEGTGDFLGGKGAQLNVPQWSDPLAARDRLQIEALRGLEDSKKTSGLGALSGGLAGALAGAKLGRVGGPWGALAGAVVGGIGGGLAGDVAEEKASDAGALKMITDGITGAVSNAFTDSLLFRGVRGVQSIFD